MPVQIAVVVLIYRLGIIRLLPMLVQLNQNNQVTINRNVSNRIIGILEVLMNIIVEGAARTNRNIIRALRILLALAFRIMSPVNRHNGENRENLVVMIIDRALGFVQNPLAAINEFNRYGITVAVLNDTIFNGEVSDYYRILARYITGEFILVTDASDILERAISAAIYGEDILRQAFHFVYEADVPLVMNHTDDMNEHVEITDGVGDMPFDHGLSQ